MIQFNIISMVIIIRKLIVIQSKHYKNTVKMSSEANKNIIDGYEKLKTVGKGAFGTATLYKRIKDNKSVVIKEIFLHDLSKSDKNSALNEVMVISSLNHPNIIRYIGNFEKEESVVIMMEYADGGNLAQLISMKKERQDVFREKTIISVFSQIADAVSYMHKKNILHRDLKSANIFLNKNGTVKIGDFGISKILTTHTQAQTVVGTPYYLSPEICEGSDYNAKSDVWAMGCILYEMTCLRKPFEAKTLPVLIQRITNCTYEEIPKIYSTGLSKLIHIILQKDYKKRPSAQYIKSTIIPSLQCDDINEHKLENSLSSIFENNSNTTSERSLLYAIEFLQNELNVEPINLPHKKIIDCSASDSHFIVVTSDHLVYTWGDNSHGQLGHGEINSFHKYPICLNYLRHKNIIRCASGYGFSIFLNSSGVLFSCGDGNKGCLGLGDWNGVSVPTIISKMLTVQITDISCGLNHVLALSSNGIVFSWGSSQYGQLGQGHTQQCCSPVSLQLSNEYRIQSVFTGVYSSILLTTNGQILGCGDNSFYKLGIPKKEVVTLFTPIKIVNEKIKHVAIGTNNTVLVTNDGKIITISKSVCDNSKTGNTSCINLQYVATNEKIMAFCGTTFSLGVTDKNTLLMWGSYEKTSHIDDQINDRSQGNESISQSAMKLIYTPLRRFSAASSSNGTNLIKKAYNSPTCILALYASDENIKNNNMLWMGGVQISNNNIFVLVHTTVLPPKRNINEYSTFSSSKTKSHIQVGPSKSNHLPNSLQIL